MAAVFRSIAGTSNRPTCRLHPAQFARPSTLAPAVRLTLVCIISSACSASSLTDTVDLTADGGAAGDGGFFEPEPGRVDDAGFPNEDGGFPHDGGVVEAAKNGPPNFVLVIGGSLNSRHMGLYGYPRDTTPSLTSLASTGDLVRLNNAFANHVESSLSLSLALTNATQDELEPADLISIVDEFNEAEFETAWLTTRALSEDPSDVVSAIARQARVLVVLDAPETFDEAVLTAFEKAIRTPAPNGRAIIVHLQGSQADYCDRFPADHTRFAGPLDKGAFGLVADDLALAHTVNCYDNSVSYNDQVVGEIIRLTLEADGPGLVVYLSDHGEDVLGGKGSDVSDFSYEMTRIPLLVWMSPQMQADHPGRLPQLLANQDAWFSSDRLFDTVIGLTGIASAHYRSDQDLSSASYTLADEEAVTLHGERRWASPSNSEYWQWTNMRFVDDDGQLEKLIPHHVNSTGMLSDAWSKGVRGVEIDVLFNYHNDGRFIVGHNHGIMGTDLETFLNSIPVDELQKLWLDFKNLDGSTHPAALQELERLDALFDLKHRTFVESGWRSNDYADYADAGWTTTYYLYSHDILIAWEAQDEAALEAFAEDIASSVVSLKTSSISFHTQFYPFVKAWVEPRIDPGITYHMWFGLDLDAPGFQEQATLTEMYQDERVATMLAEYSSPFFL